MIHNLLCCFRMLTPATSRKRVTMRMPVTGPEESASDASTAVSGAPIVCLSGRGPSHRFESADYYGTFDDGVGTVPVRTSFLAMLLAALYLLPVGHSATLAAPEAPKAESGNAAIELGKKEFEKGRYAAAVKQYTAALNEKPPNPEAYLLRGRAYGRLGENAKASQDFSRYIEARPSDPAGYIARGDTRNFSGEFESALTDFDAAIKLAPSSVDAYLGRGLARAGLEQYDLAIKDYQWVLVLQPTNREVLTNLGVACMLARRRLEAVQYLERALKQEPDPKWRQRINDWLETIVQNPHKEEKRPLGPTKKPLW
jgi:tetratricopeptide (TPR) repeat protein